MIERTVEREQSILVLEVRVPDTRSAIKAEHRWHQPDPPVHADVTDWPTPKTLATAQAIREDVVEREDMEYRVVLRTTTMEGWVVA